MHSASAARLSRDELTTAGRRGSVTVNTTACRADQTENCVSDNFAADENCPVAVSVTAVVSGGGWSCRPIARGRSKFMEPSPATVVPPNAWKLNTTFIMSFLLSLHGSFMSLKLTVK